MQTILINTMLQSVEIMACGVELAVGGALLKPRN